MPIRENMAIAACTLGLGSGYLAGFKPALLAPGGKALLKELQVPEGYEPLYGLAIGYASEDPGERPARNPNVIAKID